MELKQAIVVRRDLKLGKGKIAAQVAHAAVSCYIKTLSIKREWAEKWVEQGQKKVVLRVNSLSELLELARKAKALGLPYVIVRDAGLTQVDPGTVTALGIGPAPSDLIDKVTGKLKLL